MRKSYAASALIFLLLFSHPLLSQVFNSPHFEIHSENQNFSEQVSQILEQGYDKASAYFQTDIAAKVEVYVTSSAAEFDQLVGSHLPDWSVACAIPDQNLIVLKSPDQFHYRKNLDEVLRHELAHIFLGYYTAEYRLPLWMNEGFAVWFSEKWGWGERILVARAVLTGSIFSLNQIDSLHFFQESKAQLAYALGFLAVSHLEAEYGEGAFRRVLDHYSQTRDWNQAFLAVTGLNYAGFENEFEQMARKRYNWVTILVDSPLLWTGLALLFVLLYFVKRRRARKILKRWELEEKGLAPRDSDFY